MEKEIIEVMNRCYKGKQISALKIISKELRQNIIKRLYINGNRYEKIFIYLKYKPEIGHYGEIL